MHDTAAKEIVGKNIMKFVKIIIKFGGGMLKSVENIKHIAKDFDRIVLRVDIFTIFEPKMVNNFHT